MKKILSRFIAWLGPQEIPTPSVKIAALYLAAVVSFDLAVFWLMEWTR